MTCRRRNFGCTALYSQLSAVFLHSQEPTILLLSSFGKHYFIDLTNSHNIELKVHQHVAQILDSFETLSGCTKFRSVQLCQSHRSWLELTNCMSAMVIARGLPACFIVNFPSQYCDSKHEGQRNRR